MAMAEWVTVVTMVPHTVENAQKAVLSSIMVLHKSKVQVYDTLT